MTAVYFAPVAVDWTAVFAVAMVMVALSGAIAVLPDKPRRIVLALLIAILGVGVGIALAVPYKACDPLWKLLGWC